MSTIRNEIIGAFHACADEGPFRTRHIRHNTLKSKEKKDELSNIKPFTSSKEKSEIISPVEQTKADDDKMYVNITSSPRKRPLLAQSKKDSSEEKESLSKMIESGNNLLKSIISALSDSGTYEMSDWEDEEPMKLEDIDQECETFDGKKIPSWALVEPLKKSIYYQKQADGDKIFANLPRRCNLEAVFGTKSIPYYTRQKKPQ